MRTPSRRVLLQGPVRPVGVDRCTRSGPAAGAVRLSGSISRPRAVTWGDREASPLSMMISRVSSPALPDLRSALRLAGPARPLADIQERGTAGAAARGRRAAPHQAQAPVGLGRPRGARRADPVPLEYSTEGLTCPIASRPVAVRVGWPGAAQDRLLADVPGPRCGFAGVPRRPVKDAM